VSRLDSAIRRLVAQRACLDQAAKLIADRPGPVLELGLGNGRTYDHLRKLLPEREIFVFDRRIAAHPECIPDETHMILGDLRETIPNALERIGACAVLVHADVGTANAGRNAALAAWLGEALAPLVAPGVVVATDQALTTGEWAALPLPEGVAEGRYFLYRASA
jgi:hypothetical protein